MVKNTKTTKLKLYLGSMDEGFPGISLEGVNLVTTLTVDILPHQQFSHLKPGCKKNLMSDSYWVTFSNLKLLESKHGRIRKNFLRTQKIRIITFEQYLRTFKYGQLPLENIYEHLNTDNLCRYKFVNVDRRR